MVLRLARFGPIAALIPYKVALAREREATKKMVSAGDGKGGMWEREHLIGTR